MLIDNKLLNQLQTQAKASSRLRTCLDLRNNSDECSQRMLNVMEKGTFVPIHRHKDTDETAFIIRGKVDEIFYDDNGCEIKKIHLDSQVGNFGLQIPAGTWHTVEVLESSVMLEVKAGKYQPISADDMIEK